jgi:hypothetical protein
MVAGRTRSCLDPVLVPRDHDLALVGVIRAGDRHIVGRAKQTRIDDEELGVTVLRAVHDVGDRAEVESTLVEHLVPDEVGDQPLESVE